MVETQILNRLIDYFKISGRITRKTFILRMLGLLIASFLVILLFLAFDWLTVGILSKSADLVITILYGAVLWLSVVLFIFFIFAQEIKRLHDMNSSGWWLLLRFIPIVSLFYLLWLLIGSGTVGPNKYGDDPKNRIKEMDENVY